MPQWPALFFCALGSIAGGRQPVSETIAAARAFLEAHGGWMHSGMSIVDDQAGRGRGVVATEFIAKDSLILTVPQKLFISRLHLNGSHESILRRESTPPPLFEAVDALEELHGAEDLEPMSFSWGPDAAVAAWLASAFEDPDSPWQPYLRMIRGGKIAHDCDMGLSHAKMDDRALLLELMKRIAAKPSHGGYLETAVQFHHRIAEHVDQDLRQLVSLRRYLQAMYVLMTRTFTINGIRTDVPMASFFNHAYSPSAIYTMDTETPFQVWATVDLNPGDAITVSYNDLGNDYLFSQYGFTLPPHLDEMPAWSWSDDFQRVYQQPPPVFFLRAMGEDLAAISSFGYSVLDVLKNVVEPRLADLLEGGSSATSQQPMPQTLAEQCRYHERQIQIAGERALRRYKAVMEANKGLAAMLGDQFVEDLLASGTGATAYINAAWQRFGDAGAEAASLGNFSTAAAGEL